jgi:dihydroorotate dehydrogenase (NAD+) catalytic subunit
VSGGLLNAIGLANPGARAFAEELATIKGNRYPIIVSIFGGGPSEFSRVVEILDAGDFMAYELNLSCPHVEGVGTEVGHDPELVARVVKSVRSKTSKAIFAKLSPNTHRNIDIAKAAIDAGAAGLTAVNTLRAMAIDVELQRPILSNKFGGLSGSALKPVAVRTVFELAEAFDVPIIASGGASNWEDAAEFLLAGASAVEVGTALMNGFRVFDQINFGLRQYLRKKRIKKVKELVGNAHGS